MLKSLTYQQKLKWLGIVAILSFVIVYTLAVKKTFEEKSTCEEKQKTLEFSKDLDNKLAQIKMELVKLERVTGQKPDSSKKVIALLLESISEYCNKNGCILKEIPRPIYSKDPNFDIETNVITVEGDYAQLLNLLYLLEQKEKSGGRLSSLYFSTKKNNNTKRINLELTMYFQEFNKLQNESN